MRKNYREEDSTVNYIVRSGKLTISNLTNKTPTYDVKFAALPVRETDLNFGTGTAGSMLQSIFAHLDIISTRDRIVKDCKHRITLEELIQNTKQVTGAEIFHDGSSRLGQTIP